MDAWRLPTMLNVGGVDWKIRTDFRVILDVLINFSNSDYDEGEKRFICLDSIYEGFCDYLPDDLIQINMSEKNRDEALTKAFEFIDMGLKDDGKQQLHTVDWKQGAPIIISTVSQAVGKEVRSLEYMHWWMFLRAYMESGKGCSRRLWKSGRRKQKENAWKNRSRNFIRIIKR